MAAISRRFISAGAILDQLVEGRADLREEQRHTRAVEPLAQHHYAIKSGKFHHMAAKSLAHKAFHAIPVDRARHKLAREGDTESRYVGPRGEHVNREEPPSNLARAAQHGAE